MMDIISTKDVFRFASTGKRRRIVIVKAGDEVVLSAAREIVDRNLARVILVDDRTLIESAADSAGIDISGMAIVDIGDPAQAAARAVQMIHAGEADIPMKGMIETRIFMHAIVATEGGLKLPGRTISSMLAVEWKEKGRFLFLTDIGFIPAPSLEQKKQIIENAVDTLHKLGIARPKVAVVCASETVNPRMQATVDAAELQRMNDIGEITGCDVAGPISLDIAISAEAAKHKRYVHPVGGCADVLVMPSLEVGNVMAKTIDYFTSNVTSAIVMGASVPIIFTSRGNTLEAKMNAAAFAAVLSDKNEHGRDGNGG